MVHHKKNKGCLAAILAAVVGLSLVAGGFAIVSADSVASLVGMASWSNGQFKRWKGIVTPVIQGTSFQQSTTGAAGENVHVYRVGAFCSAGGTSTLTIADGATTVLTQPAGTVGAGLQVFEWPVALTGTAGNTVTVTLAACGGGATGTINLTADRF